jgi:DNA-binding IclR family transcriptional regulator
MADRLSPIQRAILVELAERGPLRPASIRATRTPMRLLNLLEERGYVEWNPRTFRWSITSAGRFRAT